MAEGLQSVDWRSFPLTRLKLFAGRNLGSLSDVEFWGLCNSRLLDKIRANWDEAAPDIHDLYHAILQRQQAEEVNLSETNRPLTMAEPPSTFDALPESPTFTATQTEPPGQTLVSVQDESGRFILRPRAIASPNDVVGQSHNDEQQSSSPAPDISARVPGTNGAEQTAEHQEPPKATPAGAETILAQSHHLEWTASAPDASLIVFQRICHAIETASELDVLSGLKTASERLALAALVKDDLEARQRFSEARVRAMQRMGEVFGELKRPSSPRNETGKFTSEPTENRNAAEHGEEGKFKVDVAKEVGLSLDTMERYQALAGPPECRETVKAATEEYFAAKRQKTQLPTAKGLLQVVGIASGVEAAPPPQRAPTRPFMLLLEHFAKHVDDYDPRAFANDEKLVAVYRRVAEKFPTFVAAFDLEVAGS
jgi:hypothetical protein